MAKPRYYWVLRGARTAAARTKLLDTIAGLGVQRPVGTPAEPRPASIPLYVNPFSLTLGADVLVQVSALQPSWNLMSGFSEVSSRVKTALTGTDASVKLKGFKPARVIRTVEGSGAGSVQRSKATGLEYIKYPRSSTSIPFGRKTADTTISSVFSQIRTQAGAGQANVKFRLQEEQF